MGKVAIITGGDSGLGRAAAIAFAKEGANVVIPYFDEHIDADETKRIIESYNQQCLLLSGDISKREFCEKVVCETIQRFGKIDILVNNAGVQYQSDTLEGISDEQFDWTMKVNIYGMFYYMSGFVGYLVLAYYLVKYPLTWSWKRTLGITLPMFLIGYTVTSLGFVLTQKYFPGSYANLEIIWYFSGINVFMMTFPVFVIVQKLNVPSAAWLSRLASLTFGIYLCHFVFVQVAYDLLGTVSGLPVIVRILGMACLAFGISWLLVWGMKAFSWTRRLVM